MVEGLLLVQPAGFERRRDHVIAQREMIDAHAIAAPLPRTLLPL